MTLDVVVIGKVGAMDCLGGMDYSGSASVR
jgi:hypothetical protein